MNKVKGGEKKPRRWEESRKEVVYSENRLQMKD